jgi:hypothetical protein
MLFVWCRASFYELYHPTSNPHHVSSSIAFAEQKLIALKQRFEAVKAEASEADKNALIDEINQQLGDSVEKMLLIKTILDSIERGVE